MADDGQSIASPYASPEHQAWVASMQGDTEPGDIFGNPVPMPQREVIGPAGRAAGFETGIVYAQPQQVSMMRPAEMDPFAGITFEPGEPMRQVGGGGSAPMYPVTRQQREALFETKKAQATAEEEKAKIAGQMWEETGQMWAGLGKRMEDKTKEFDQRRKKLMKILAPEEGIMLAMMRDLQGKKVDPDRWWSTREAPAKLTMLLSVAMGGFLEGFTGGRVGNTAAKMIDKYIDRDIAAQRANIVAAQGNLSAQKGIVAYYAGKVGDLDRAEMLAKQQMIEHAKMMISEVQARHKGAASYIEGNIAKARLTGEGLKEMYELQMRQGTRQWSSSGVKGGAQAIIDGKKYPLQQFLQVLKAKKALGMAGPKKLTAGEAERLSSGMKGIAGLSDFWKRVYSHKKDRGWTVPEKWWDIIGWGRSKLIPKDQAMWMEHMTWAMYATRALSGAQAHVREMLSQQMLQPKAIDSWDTLKMKRKNAMKHLLDGVIMDFKTAVARGQNLRPVQNAAELIIREIADQPDNEDLLNMAKGILIEGGMVPPMVQRRSSMPEPARIAK